MLNTEAYDNGYFAERCAEDLRYVADHIGEYIPDKAILLDGTELVVRVGNPRDTIPIVELRAEMPACAL